MGRYMAHNCQEHQLAACVLHLAAAHTRVWILLWLQFQQKFFSVRPGEETLKVCSFLAASFDTSNKLRVKRQKFTVSMHKHRE